MKVYHQQTTINYLLQYAEQPWGKVHKRHTQGHSGQIKWNSRVREVAMWVKLFAMQA